MSSNPVCPSAAEVDPVVLEPAYDAFVAGWRIGSRRAIQPASQDVIEQVATMLDAALVSDARCRPK